MKNYWFPLSYWKAKLPRPRRLPVAFYVASHYQQRIGRLTAPDMRELNSALKEVQNLQPCLLYLAPLSEFKAKYLAFSDVSQGKYSYGQTGYIYGFCSRHNRLSCITYWTGTVLNKAGYLSRPLAARFLLPPLLRIVLAL